MLRVAGGFQLTGQVIGPRMVRAHEVVDRSRTLHQVMRTVLADVVKATEHTIGSTDGNDWHSGDRVGHVVARITQPLGVAQPLPRATDDPLLIGLEPALLRVGIGMQRQRRAWVPMPSLTDGDRRGRVR